MLMIAMNPKHTKTKRAGNKVKRSNLRLERLEDRKMMAANLMADLYSSGVLRIEGTERNDTIVVRQINNSLSVDNIRIRNNGSMLSRVSANAVSRIDVYGLGGNDTILLNSDSVSGQQSIYKPSRIFGGNGADSIVGGRGADSIWGGSGHDRIWGHYGNDTLYGDSGDDQLIGGFGNDVLYGGDGNDKLWGSDGNDTLYGGNNNDDLMGGNHNDNLYGGNGDDRLWGEAGLDGLYGGAGTDQMWGGSGSDRLLVMSGSREHKDATSADAVLVFKNGNKTWNAGEIEKLDSAFKILHLKTRNDRLLETASRGTVTIVRDASSGNARGANFNNGTIKMYDAAFSNANQAAQTMLHELAHNFDTEGAGWGNWLNLSSWRNSAPPSSIANLYQKSEDGAWWHRKSATFARDYGMHNPREDWATAWESYFKYKHSLPTNTSVNALSDNKTNYLDAFFARLA